ncbi:Pre-mrna-processing protein 40c [Thalictrum thalictroides]|uniref:Pre-mrna-processing protein 40c n=1 Tax=Thalictrum thalictroides TaxID=46969 RepID=A0A7J6WE97_THATH|nr:Pre-mrna-processing protein 40c [Thalictrum thalictroides]
MSSPAWSPRDTHSTTGITQQLSVSGPTATLIPQTSAPSASCVDSQTLQSPSKNASDLFQESGQANHSATHHHIAPPPSFSYGAVPMSISMSESSQEASSTPATKSNPAASNAVIQPPGPVQSPGAGASFSYNIVINNNVGSSAGQQIQSNSNSSTAALREAGTCIVTSSGSESLSVAAHSSLSSSSTAATPNLFPTAMWMTTTPSFTAHPGRGGSPAIPGPPGIHLPGSFCSNNTVRSMPPVLPFPATLPPNSVAQQIYPTFQSLPAMAPPPQAHWLQPPQIAGIQRPQYLQYPAMITNPFPLPVRGMAHPSFSLPDSQPPGVSLLGPPAGTSLDSVGSIQYVRSSEMQSELPPPGTDHEKKGDDNGGLITVSNEEADAWTAHKTDTGAVYYYNAVTGESTYEKPHGYKGELDKVTVQSTPVSWEKLGSTDWALVTTDDGKKYYYNNKTKVSSWQIPMEVTEWMKTRHEEDPLRANTISMQNSSMLHEKGSGSISLNTPAVNNGGRDAIALRPSSLPGSSSALDMIKKKLQDSGMPIASSSLPASSGPSTSDANGLRVVDATVKGPQDEDNKDKQKDANGGGNISDSSSDSEDVDSGPTKEECIIKFKEMLKERGVAPFSKWEKELPKILFDPRFKAVPSHSARRSLFEHYVRTRAEEERKEKRAAQKSAVEGFRKLLEEASEDIDHKTDYQSFKEKWGSDPRFEALDRKEREVLLKERVLALRRAVEEKLQATRAAATSSFKSMLRDKSDINSNTRWSRVKDSLRSDPRYKSVRHEDRELLFNEYISELRAVEEEVDRATKAKREEQDKLKEREREMRKRKEREEQEVERVRLKVRRNEALSSYQALLVETIKDPQASWTESKPKLEKDSQGRATNPDLDKSDTEKLFREHVKTLYERCAREFQALLAEVISTEAATQVTEDGKSSLTSWSTAKRILKTDSRYSKMPRKDRESLWRRYAEEIQRKRKLASDPTDDRINTEKRSRNSLDSVRSPAESRRIRERR